MPSFKKGNYALKKDAKIETHFQGIKFSSITPDLCFLCYVASGSVRKEQKKNFSG